LDLLLVDLEEGEVNFPLKELRSLLFVEEAEDEIE
jgi:hypothetical protein